MAADTEEGDEKRPCVSAFVDSGEFDPDVAGGVARSRAKCCALPNGDIVVCDSTFVTFCLISC